MSAAGFEDKLGGAEPRGDGGAAQTRSELSRARAESVLRASFPPSQLSKSAIRVRYPSKVSESAIRVSYPGQLSGSAIRISYPSQPSRPAIRVESSCGRLDRRALARSLPPATEPAAAHRQAPRRPCLTPIRRRRALARAARRRP